MSIENYQSKVRGLGCVLCQHLGLGNTPAQIHHVESVRDALSEYAVVPLCHEHHEGAAGVHGLRRKGFERVYKLTDVDLLALVNKGLEKAA